MEQIRRCVPLLGRILIGAPFLYTGWGKLVAHDATVAYIASAGLPLPSMAYFVALAVEIGGGCLLILGYHARLVALLVAVFTLVAAFAFHQNFADQNQTINFLKNLVIAGGLLQIVYFGAGPLSVDQRSR